MLQVDAVVNPTNESLTDKNPITLRLMEIAGPELKEACKTQVGCKCLIVAHRDLLTLFICMQAHIQKRVQCNEGWMFQSLSPSLSPSLALSQFYLACRTGEAKITGGFKLPARYVLHCRRMM